MDIPFQKFPGDLLSSTFPNPDNLEDVRGRTEVRRRDKYIEMMESRISNYPALVQLVKQTLHNVPDQRPNADELLTTLQRMKVEVEGEYGGSPIRVDMVRVRLAKEVNLNKRMIQELTQQQVSIAIMSNFLLHTPKAVLGQIRCINTYTSLFTNHVLDLQYM